MHPQRDALDPHKMKPRIRRRPHIHRRHPLGILRGATRAHYLRPWRPQIHFAPFRARGAMASMASLITRDRGTDRRRRASRASTRSAPGVGRKVSGEFFVIRCRRL